MRIYRVTGVSGTAAITTVRYIKAPSALDAIDAAANRFDGVSLTYLAERVS